MDIEQTPAKNQNKKDKLKFVKQFRFTPKEKKLWKVALGTLLLVALIAGLVGAGYNRGYQAGKKAGVTTKNPYDFLNSENNPFRSFSGTVSDVTKDSVTVDTNQGKKETIKITDKTKVTQKTETRAVSDITKGKKITVFAQGSGGDRAATRIVIRD